MLLSMRELVQSGIWSRDLCIVCKREYYFECMDAVRIY